MKVFYFAAVVAAMAVTKISARVPDGKSIGILEKHPIDYYDCSNKADGNYESPRSCNQFISCSGGVASERDCAICYYDPVRCPNERLVYNVTLNNCVWADETRCGGSGGGETPEPTPLPVSSTDGTTRRQPETTQAPPANNSTPDPERPPQEGDDCDPELCRNIGYCQHYLRCNNSTRKLVREECGQDLVWNPNGSGKIHGGNCDNWENLDRDVEDEYRKDKECLRCFWEEISECNREYRYQAPNLRHRDVQTLTCAEGLVFVEALETCKRCEDVARANGTTCC